MPSQATVYTCKNCGWADFHTALACPRCLGDLTQTTTSGVGKIVTFTVVRYPPKGFENQAPYTVAIIDLENGLRVIGRLSKSSEDVKIGGTVSLTSSREDALEFQLSF